MYKDEITEIIIEDGVASIGDGAFSYCSSLTSVTIPDSVTSIGSGAFCACRSLINIHIDSIESWLTINYEDSSSHPNNYFGPGNKTHHLYIGGTELTSITIPDSVTTIGEYAFLGCKNLTSITIPDSVTSISSYAFYCCSSFASITIPETVTSIGDYVFWACSSLTSITIPDSVTSIGSYAFYYCTSLTRITIPDSVTSIGDNAFCGCTSLRRITLPDGVTSIGDYAFYDCTSLTSVTIPGGVTSVGNYAFYGCSSLASVTIPDSMTSIEASAFESCYSLASIVIPENVSSIGNAAFKSCGKLAKICFWGTETSIGDFAVSNSPTIYCFDNSTAHNWALEQELDIVLLDNVNPDEYLALTLPEIMRIPVDRTTQIPANIFTVGQIENLAWESSDNSTVIVNQNGILTPVAVGTAEITLTVDDVTARTQVTVCPLLTEVLLPDTVYAISDNYVDCFYTVEPENAICDLYVNCSDYNYASIYNSIDDNSGYLSINGKAVGTTTIDVTDRISGYKKTLPLHIGRKITSASFAKKEICISVGEHVQLKANVSMGQYTFDNQLVQWNADRGYQRYISLDRNTGEIVGLSVGEITVNIIDLESNILDTCTVTVTDSVKGKVSG